MRFLPPLLALVALSACGGGDAAGNATTATPVAGVAAPAGKPWTETVAVTPEGGYRIGNPDAAIKLVEYGSRTCPTCGAFAREGNEPLIANYVSTGKVSFEFRDFAVHGAPDLAAAVLGRCNGTATFFPLLEAMYQDQLATLDRMQAIPQAEQARLQSIPPVQAIAGWADAAGFVDFVKQRGVPEAKARECLRDQKLIDQVVKITEEGGATVTGTPTFLINGEKVENAVQWKDIEAALKGAGA
ncbi:protein-disulfide isomerase [Sphingomonas sp. Leaf407]|uniref:thioredoxin domain-containing protein n=1 Tax=unclassified Sphingomonas TaxID=196159 RepID=UPI0007013296|nr:MULTISPECIES: thioredoxin domain-containing protein [unclassified Sphingomonas]KQN35567.1 protein-disulfide isomerase [Sphingomonas sp. Leaf42]KQT26434.1 protein-disulfide isomerase [Sphingomonas sp. Leaf407]